VIVPKWSSMLLRSDHNKIKHAIKLKTSPENGAPSYGCKLKMLTRAATVVQVVQDLFYVLLHVLFYL